MVTLPLDLLRDVDTTAQELGRNRSEFVRQALSDLIRRVRERKFEELLAEGYRESAAESAAVAAGSLLAQAAAAEGTWQWDE